MSSSQLDASLSILSTTDQPHTDVAEPLVATPTSPFDAQPPATPSLPETPTEKLRDYWFREEARCQSLKSAQEMVKQKVVARLPYVPIVARYEGDLESPIHIDVCDVSDV